MFTSAIPTPFSLKADVDSDTGGTSECRDLLGISSWIAPWHKMEPSVALARSWGCPEMWGGEGKGEGG